MTAPFCAAAALTLAVGGCGAGSGDQGRRARSAAQRPRAATTPVSSGRGSELDGDRDVDRLYEGPADTDNDAVPAFGPPASASDRRAILALIRRYYAIAATGNGVKACSMLYSITVERLIEEQRRGRRDTCAQIVSRLFRQHHRELEEDVKGPTALAVQVKGNRGYALMRFPARHELRELQVLVHRDGGGWVMEVPLDGGAQ